MMPPEWRGLTYQQIHDKEAPCHGCECDHCEMMREFEIWDEYAYDEGVNAGVFFGQRRKLETKGL